MERSDCARGFPEPVLGEPLRETHPPRLPAPPADLFFAPRDAMDLAAFLRQLPPDVPLLWIGLGSNLLVRDGGIRGPAISTHGRLGPFERLSPTRIQAETGSPCARIARQCVQWGLGATES